MPGPDQAMAVATQALQAAQSLGIPLTLPLVDSSALGSFWVRVGVTIDTTPTAIAIQLPRAPTMYWVVRQNTNATIFDPGAPAWTSTNITLTATETTVATLLVG